MAEKIVCPLCKTDCSVLHGKCSCGAYFTLAPKSDVLNPQLDLLESLGCDYGNVIAGYIEIDGGLWIFMKPKAEQTTGQAA